MRPFRAYYVALTDIDRRRAAVSLSRRRLTTCKTLRLWCGQALRPCRGRRRARATVTSPLVRVRLLGGNARHTTVTVLLRLGTANLNPAAIGTWDSERAAIGAVTVTVTTVTAGARAAHCASGV